MDELEARPLLEEGEARLRQGDWAQAEAAFRRAISVFPDSPIPHSKLGVALAQQGQLDPAVATFRKAIGINPRYAPAHSNLGNALRKQGRLPEALAAYERAIEADPDYWVARQNLGSLYKEMGRVGDAVHELKTATRLSARGPRSERSGCLRQSLIMPLLVAMGSLPFLAAAFKR